MANKQKKGRHTAFITYQGSGEASGWAYFESLCDSGNSWKLAFNIAYGANACNIFDPPETIDCDFTNRIVLTSEV